VSREEGFLGLEAEVYLVGANSRADKRCPLPKLHARF
jgi:hypothetical protein